MPIFGHSDQEMVEAQWQVVQSFRRAAAGELPLSEMLDRIEDWTPESWATTAMQTIIAFVGERQNTIDRNDRELQMLRLRCRHLERVIERHEASPLKRRIESIQDALVWQKEEYDEQFDRAETLEASLNEAQVKIAHLQSDIKTLNRILVEQQESLNNQK
jgi:chromosome segregation ATPase